MLSRQQKAVIRKVAKMQEESFMRIIQEGRLSELLQEMIEEGYEVTLSDLEEKATQYLEIWDAVRDNPDKFLNTLDEFNLGMIRHILVNEFRSSESVRTIHRKLNLFEEISKFQN